MRSSRSMGCYSWFAESVFQHILVFAEFDNCGFRNISFSTFKSGENFLVVGDCFANLFEMGDFFYVFGGYLHFVAEDLIFIVGKKIVDTILTVFKLGDKTLKASFTFIYG